MNVAHPLSLLLAIACCAPGCQASKPTGRSPRALYESLMRDLTLDTQGGLRPSTLAAQEARCTRIREWHDEGKLETAADFYYAAAVLVESDAGEDIALAGTLASRAVELGEDLGLTLVAYASDKQAVNQRAEHQRYGTVIVYEPVLERFTLYPVDPVTTDVERRSMGVPPLAELLAEVEELNRSSMAERLRASETMEDPLQAVREPGEVP